MSGSISKNIQKCTVHLSDIHYSVCKVKLKFISDKIIYLYHITFYVVSMKFMSCHWTAIQN